MDETKTMAKFVKDTSFEDLPPPLIDEFRIFVLDTIGAAFVGSMQPWTRTLVDVTCRLGGKEQATAINQTWKTDVSRAALVNGTMIGSFECEPLTGTHASGTVLPAVLAVCESEHKGGKEFLTSLIVGAEVSGRLSRTAIGLESERGFHNPGTQGPFAAAVAVGKLHGFDEAMLVNAMGIAGSHACGLLEFAWEGANTKRMHLGRAAQLGLESALLAEGGFSGPSTILEGRYGYYNAFSLPTTLEKLTEDLGEKWAVQPPSHKSFATHATHQAIVQAIQDFKREHPYDPKDIKKVIVRGPERIMESRHSVREAGSVMAGQYSLPVTTAVALTRDLSNPLSYDDAALSDPLVRRLAQDVELQPVHADPAGGIFTGEVLLELQDGTYTLGTNPFRGSPRNPFTWDTVCEKFSRYAGQAIDSGRVNTIVDSVKEIEDLPDMANLAELLSAKG
jgi:2-methylcitrate dehydratase PrpD